MTGQVEAEEITINEMRIRIPGGPRHYVQAIIREGDPKDWLVDHKTITMENDDVVGFLSSDDAYHFINQKRARDLGRWNNVDELFAAYRAQAERDEEQAASEAAPEKRGPGRKKKDAA